MPSDLESLAQLVTAQIPQALGCAVISTEGVALATHPPHIRDLLEPLGRKLAILRDVRAAFLEFSGSSIFFLKGETRSYLAITPQEVEFSDLLAQFKDVLTSLENGTVVQASTVLVPELVPVAASSEHTADADFGEYGRVDSVGLAQEFASLLEQSFGQPLEETDDEN